MQSTEADRIFKTQSTFPAVSRAVFLPAFLMRREISQRNAQVFRQRYRCSFSDISKKRA